MLMRRVGIALSICSTVLNIEAYRRVITLPVKSSIMTFDT